MERMILDKFSHSKILPKLSIFGILGLANGFCYGLSLFMDKKNYDSLFAYKGDGSGAKFLRA